MSFFNDTMCLYLVGLHLTEPSKFTGKNHKMNVIHMENTGRVGKKTIHVVLCATLTKDCPVASNFVLNQTTLYPYQSGWDRLEVDPIHRLLNKMI